MVVALCPPFDVCMENGLITNLINEIIRNEYLARIFGGKETFNREKVKIKIEFGEREREWSAWVPNNRRML